MIDIKLLGKSEPNDHFKYYYNQALERKQKNIEAITICSFNFKNSQPECRLVNLKYIFDNHWIFFSNYNSQKSKDFKSCNKISALIFWNQINTQIRIKAKINKLSNSLSDEHYSKRSKEKNALAHISNQSNKIKSYEDIEIKYNNFLKKEDIVMLKRPSYWGGYYFEPYYFEFWEGHESRINKRKVFELIDGNWEHSFLQP